MRTRGSTKSWRSCQPRLKSWKHRRRRSARTIGATIVLLFCAALVWAWEAEYRHTLSDELAKAEQKASGLTQDLIKAEQKTRLQPMSNSMRR